MYSWVARDIERITEEVKELCTEKRSFDEVKHLVSKIRNAYMKESDESAKIVLSELMTTIRDNMKLPDGPISMYGWYDYRDQCVRYIFPSILQVELCFGNLDAMHAFGEIVKVDINIMERVAPTFFTKQT